MFCSPVLSVLSKIIIVGMAIIIIIANTTTAITEPTISRTGLPVKGRQEHYKAGTYSVSCQL